MALQERLVDILKANYKFWIIPNIVSYQLPVQYRVPALSVCGFVWSIYCSHFAKKCGDDVDSRQRQARAAQLSAKECSFEVLEDEQRDCLLDRASSAMRTRPRRTRVLQLQPSEPPMRGQTTFMWMSMAVPY